VPPGRRWIVTNVLGLILGAIDTAHPMILAIAGTNVWGYLVTNGAGSYALATKIAVNAGESIVMYNTSAQLMTVTITGYDFAA
jgi:F420-0:gamma-glutamyl ligase-like protein